MDLNAFEAALKADGFSEIETRTIAPDVINAAHAHPFAVRFLVLRGEITIASGGAVSVCRKGDTFALPADCEHDEKIGAEGVTYLVGRKR